jgi:hypothetical protein
MNFEPRGIIRTVCIVITVAMVMLMRDFGPYGIMFVTACVYCFKIFPSSLTGNLIKLKVEGACGI